MKRGFVSEIMTVVGPLLRDAAAPLVEKFIEEARERILKVLGEDADFDLDLHLAIFGLTRDCSRRDLEAAFRKLVLEYHPDHDGNEQLYKQVVESRDLIIAELTRIKGAWK